MQGDNNGNVDECGDVDLRDDTRISIGTVDRMGEFARPIPDVAGRETQRRPDAVGGTARDRDD